MSVTVQREGSVAVLNWDDNENRVNVDTLAELNGALDEAQSIEGPLSLVVAGVGKYFCNGMDLNRFAARSPEFATTMDALNLTIARLMVFPGYTVAAINGHAFAAGAMLSCGFDYRVMREDRGYWCLNEAEIGIAINDRAFSTVSHRMPFATATDAVLTARRYTGPEALAASIIEATALEGDVLAHALDVAERASRLDRATLTAHKRMINGDQARRLGLDVPAR
ncbi:MAG TPA: enoyl-CoA hydratase/isomerase family protein [Acidimicrobiales bacterium]|jgi:enoyl-CoA hydratase/carnithine racemase|nr:enoyl-CoA hydratase/isomerase family protein [Acidimicrobiales bacterium]